jgi:hypothetical protein
VAVVFALMWLRDRAHGGYRAKQLAPPSPLRITQN